MKRNFKIISVVGPIGAGKSTVARELAASLGVGFLADPENAVQSELLMFYGDRRQNALRAQIAFLQKRLEQLSNLSEKVTGASAIVLDYFFDNEIIFSELNLNDDEKQAYQKYYKSASNNIPGPDLVIYLKASPAQLIRRIKGRNSKMDRDIAPDYIEKVADAFENYMNYYRKAPVLKYDTEQYDFLKGGKDIPMLVSAVKENLHLQ